MHDLGTDDNYLLRAHVNSGWAVTDHARRPDLDSGLMPTEEKNQGENLEQKKHHRRACCCGALRVSDDTGTLEDVDDINTYGLEAAWVLGPLSVQGEWLQQSFKDEPNAIAFRVHMDFK